MDRGQGFYPIRSLCAGVPCEGKYAHEQPSAGRVIVGYQDLLSRFLAHLPSVIRKESAAKLYFSSCGIGGESDKGEETRPRLVWTG